jgi:hypothetical protein
MIDTSIAKQLTDLNKSLTKRLTDLDLSWERRITDSELRQSSLISEVEQRQEKLVATVVQATGALESWRHDAEGKMDDLKLKMSKLTKYMDRSVFDNSPPSIGLISSSPQFLDQTAARLSAGVDKIWSTVYRGVCLR